MSNSWNDVDPIQDVSHLREFMKARAEAEFSGQEPNCVVTRPMSPEDMDAFVAMMEDLDPGCEIRIIDEVAE
jgi:hypothetical protein